MKACLEIPPEPLDVRHNSTGFLPHVGLCRHGRLFRFKLLDHADKEAPLHNLPDLPE